MRMRTFTALLLAMPLSGCFFIFIPGAVVSKISDGITGDKGEHCVSRAAKTGDLIQAADGRLFRVVSLSGASMRCTDPALPIRAEMALVGDSRTLAQTTPPPPPPATRANLTACRSWDRAVRVGSSSDEQAAKREMTELGLNDVDCRRLIAEADR